MKKTKEIDAAEKKLKKEIEQAKKKEKALWEKLKKLRNEFPFICRKCKLAFKMNEVHVQELEVRETHQNCQYGGEYDMWQTVLRRKTACCPKCGKSFNAKVSYDEFVSETPHYSRWEDKPQLKPEYTKPLQKKTKKINACQLKYLKEHFREAGC